MTDSPQNKKRSPPIKVVALYFPYFLSSCSTDQCRVIIDGEYDYVYYRVYSFRSPYFWQADNDDGVKLMKKYPKRGFRGRKDFHRKMKSYFWGYEWLDEPELISELTIKELLPLYKQTLGWEEWEEEDFNLDELSCEE